MGYPCTVKLNIYIAILRLGLHEKKIKKQASVQLNETQNTILKNPNTYEHTEIPN